MAGSLAPVLLWVRTDQTAMTNTTAPRIAPAEKPRYNAGAPSVFTILKSCDHVLLYRSELLAHHRRLDPVHGALALTVHAAPAKPSCHANESSRPLDIFSFAMWCGCHECGIARCGNIASLFLQAAVALAGVLTRLRAAMACCRASSYCVATTDLLSYAVGRGKRAPTYGLAYIDTSRVSRRRLLSAHIAQIASHRRQLCAALP